MPSKIEWTDESWNPIKAANLETGEIGHFCVHVSPGCANCYAERMQPRFGNNLRYAAQDRAKVELLLDERTLMKPLSWRRPRMVFVCSMTDLFLDDVPREWIDQIFVVMRIAHWHTYQVLTKRPERLKAYLTDEDTPGIARVELATYLLSTPKGAQDRFGKVGWRAVEHGFGKEPDHWFDNIWLGVSVEDRARKDRIDLLRDVPAALRFLSLEPLIEDLGELDLDGIGWVIVGGESGPGARPMHPDWARSLRWQCECAGVPFFFKQWGEWVWYENLSYDEAERLAAENCPGKELQMHSCGRTAVRVGRRQAGRRLDGRLWEQMP